MTPDLLLKVMPLAGSRAMAFAIPLEDAMAEFAINTPKRQAAFLAQVAHESASLKYTLEIADGSAYEPRLDLGNTAPGDGKRYKGRGLLQITGKANYLRCATALKLPLIEIPELLEAPSAACRSAAWYWLDRGLNALADGEKFGSITKLINGGYNGLDERLTHWVRGRKVLGL